MSSHLDKRTFWSGASVCLLIRLPSSPGGTYQAPTGWAVTLRPDQPCFQNKPIDWQKPNRFSSALQKCSHLLCVCPSCWSRSQKIAILPCSRSMGPARRSCFAARAPKWSWRWKRRESRRCCLKGNSLIVKKKIFRMLNCACKSQNFES